MSSSRYDLVVAGLGALGASAAGEAAGTGARVLGIDRLAPPHSAGSSHGRTRIIRKAYFEDPAYVPLAIRSERLWRSLEEEWGRPLLDRTGCLLVGSEDGPLLGGASRSADAHRVEVERISPEEIVRRFPPLDPPAGSLGILEPGAGVLRVEEAVRALLARAATRGVEVRTGVAMVRWQAAGGGGVVLDTTEGRIRARSLVLALGPWLGHSLGPWLEHSLRPRLGPSVAPSKGVPLEVTRQWAHWFEPADGTAAERLQALPSTLWELDDGRLAYTVPDPSGELKVAFHHGGPPVDPDAAAPGPPVEEREVLRAFLTRRLPGAVGPTVRSVPCLYTSTPDRHFLLGPHPGHPAVTLAGGGSGHAFKFAPVLGEAAAAFALGGAVRRDVAFLSPERFVGH